VHQIEREEHRRHLALGNGDILIVRQVHPLLQNVKRRFPRIVERDDFAIDNRVDHWLFCKRLHYRRVLFCQVVSVSRKKLRLAFFDKRQDSDAVHFWFENPVVAIEHLGG
jgi:hypothetical protein